MAHRRAPVSLVRHPARKLADPHCGPVSKFDTIPAPAAGTCRHGRTQLQPDPHLSRFVDRQVGSGRHQTASEVVREALRRYEATLSQDEARVAAIQTAIQEGRADIARGDFTLVETAEDAAGLYAALTGRSR